MTLLRAGLALAALWLIGFLALRATGTRDRGGLGVFPADFATGAALLAGVGMGVIAAGGQITPWIVYGIGVALGAVSLAWRASAPPIPPPALPRDWTSRLLLGMAALTVAAVTAAAARDQLWWDGWAIWAFKARVLHLEGTLPRGFLTPGGDYAFSHLDYPLAVPLVDWWVYRHAGVTAPALASFAGAVWYALLPILAWDGLRQRTGPRVAAAAALSIAGFWPLAFYAIGGTADVVVAVALLGSVVELERSLSGHSRAALWRASVFLALGALAKNEGLALTMVVVAVYALVWARSSQRHPRDFAPLALPFAALAPWFIHTRSLGIGPDNFSPVPSLAAVFARVPVLFAGFVELFSSGPWLPLPLLAVIGLVAAACRRQSSLGFAWAVVGGYVVILSAIYLQAPQDLVWLIYTSLARVVGAVVPATVYLAVLSACSRPESFAPHTPNAVEPADLAVAA